VILFWVICTLCIVVALAFVLPPALQRTSVDQSEAAENYRTANIKIYRDQLSELEADLRNGIVSKEQYELDRVEIERRLLEDTRTTKNLNQTKPLVAGKNTAYALAFGIPLLAVGFYLKVGEPKSISNPPTAATARPAAGPMAEGERSQAQIEGNVAALAKRLQSNPNDLAGWTMLARSYNSMERFGEAAGAYAKATELSPKDADLWAEYAFASAMASGREMKGKPTELVNQALKVDPDNAKALQLAGTAALQAKDYKKAIEYWERVLSKLPPDSEVAQSVKERINDAKAQGNIK